MQRDQQQQDARDQQHVRRCRAGGRMSSPGNSPPNSDVVTQEPIDRDRQHDRTRRSAGRCRTARRPAASSRRSPRGSRARTASRPMIQFGSRGLRNAPVKNTRSMCTMIAAMNSSAAQWCICRMIRPPRTSNDRFSVELVRPRHRDALQRRVAAVVFDLLHRRIEEQRQERAGQQQHDERVERDLAEQERPVVREDLVEQPAQRAWPPGAGRRSRWRSRPAEPLASNLRLVHGRSQNPGPTGT